MHAAELIINAWKARHAEDPSAYIPMCVSVLEPLLSEKSTVVAALETEAVGQLLEPVMTDEDLNVILGLEFQDIDWGFWAGME
jgi:hypothetical protein